MKRKPIHAGTSLRCLTLPLTMANARSSASAIRSDPRFFHERDGKLAESFEAHLENILAIEPKTFVEVENGVAPVDGLQFEQIANFFERQHLPVVFWGPAEQTKVVEHGFRCVTVFNEVGHARSAIPLAELSALVIQDEGNVSE